MPPNPAIGAEAVDYRSTAVRPAWDELPKAVTAEIQAVVGAVTHTCVAGGGFTPAFAGVVTVAAGDRYFVKAADLDTEFGQSNRREAAVLAALPSGLAVPRLLWSSEPSGWSVLCLEAIDGHMPGQPWTSDDLVQVLAGQTELADYLACPSAAVRSAANERPLAADCAEAFDAWRQAARGAGPIPATDLDWIGRRVEELAALEFSLAEATDGTVGLMHYDLRPDNTLIRAVNRSAVVLDWNWLRPGPAWVDTIMLLATAFGQLDVDGFLAGRPTTASIGPPTVDAVLAAFGGSLVRAGDRPHIPTSPMLRRHQQAQGRRTLSWLAHRRRWI
jgi:aminoglycoside phosphotransferase (APT) family kinase protein